MDALSILLGLVVGAATGALAGAWLSGRRGAHDREALREQLGGAQAAAAAARQEFENWKLEARSRKEEQERHRSEEISALRGEFARLSQEALKLNNQLFLQQAGSTFDERRQQFEGLLTPLREHLAKLETATKALEVKREGAYEQVRQQISSLHTATEAVNHNSRTLIQALRGDARARGRWGEMALRNVAELSGMTAHCDFEVQEVLDDKSRPDMVIKLPGGDGRIPVDAKAPMDAYMRAVESADPEERKSALQEHAVAMRLHVRTLAARQYPESLGARLDLTVLFIPAEPVLAAAFEADPALQDDAMNRRILLATPVTLLALLRTVALYWRQVDVAENAQHIADAAATLHERVRVFSEHLGGLGSSLERAVKQWNKAVGSYESRVLPAGREFERLQPPHGKDRELGPLAAIEGAPRELAAPATHEPGDGDPPPEREFEAG